MKILISGGTGFIGREVLRALLKERHSVILLSRTAHLDFGLENVFVQTVWWDGRKIDYSKADFESLDAVINLSGESIAAKRWTRNQKQKIISSRIDSTRALIELISKLNIKPKLFLNASAIGYYGNVTYGEVSENSSKGKGFLSDVCEIWETEAKKAVDYGVDVTIGRIGIVLGAKGGVLKKMYPIFKNNLGAVLGSGTQSFSWIHRDDLVRALIFIVEKKITGVVNLVTPNASDMKEFSDTLAKVLGKKCQFRIPAFFLKFLLGELSSTITEGQKVIPGVLQKNGFIYKFGNLEEALISISSEIAHKKIKE